MHMHNGCGRHWGWMHHGGCGEGRHRAMGRTGNVAFDEHLAAKIEELEAEFRAFREFRAEQRRKRDAEDFAAFMAARAAKGDDQRKADE